MARERPPPDPRGGHVRVYWELLDSVAWRALSWADRGLYFAIRRKLLGSNNGNIEATIGALRHSGVTSSATLSKGLRALITAGFLEKTRQGGIAHGTKVCCLYRFTDEPVLDIVKIGLKAGPATFEFRRFKTLAEARAALRGAHAAAKRPGTKAASKLQIANRASSRSEWKASVPDSIPEAEHAAFLHRLKQGERAKVTEKPRKHTVSCAPVP
jgi:hypothetical protein